MLVPAFFVYRKNLKTEFTNWSWGASSFTCKANERRINSFTVFAKRRFPRRKPMKHSPRQRNCGSRKILEIDTTLVPMPACSSTTAFDVQVILTPQLNLMLCLALLSYAAAGRHTERRVRLPSQPTPCHSQIPGTFIFSAFSA